MTTGKLIQIMYILLKKKISVKERYECQQKSWIGQAAVTVPLTFSMRTDSTVAITKGAFRFLLLPD